MVTDWVMYEQVAYTGGNSVDVDEMMLQIPLPGKRVLDHYRSGCQYDCDPDATDGSITKTPVVPKINYTGVTGTAFDECDGISASKFPNRQKDKSDDRKSFP